jgi:glycine cleavage system H protein
MSSEQYRNFMGYLWYQKEDNIITIGVNEDGLEQIENVTSIDLPREGEEIEADVVLGSIETDDGPMDIYSPVSGKVIEINTAVIEEPDTIQEDPYEGWLLKIESTEDIDEDGDEDEDEEDEEDEDDEEDVEEDED